MKVTVVENSNPTYNASQISAMHGRTFYRSGVNNEYFFVDTRGNVTRTNNGEFAPVFVVSYGSVNEGLPSGTYMEYKGELKITVTTP